MATNADPKTPGKPSVQPELPEPVTQLEFGDAAGTRKAIFDHVYRALTKKYPISNNRYTLQLTNLRYRAPKEFSVADQKKAILRGRTLGWNMVGSWQLVDNATGKIVDKTPPRLIAKVPYLTDRGTLIFNGTEYSIASQMRLRPGVYSRIKQNGLIEAHFNVKGGTGPSFRVYMEPHTGVFRAQIGQANLKLYPILRAMGVADRDLAAAWGKDLLRANMEATDPRAVSRAYAKLVPQRVREEVEQEQQTKAAALKQPKYLVNYVEQGILQQCAQCAYFDGINSCSKVQGFVSARGWCIFWQPAFGKLAADTQRRRVQFVGEVVCDASNPKKPWIYLKVNKGLAEAAWEALAEQRIEGIEAHYDNPHITLVSGPEALDLYERYGDKWQSACGQGRKLRFSLQNAIVDLDPVDWPEVDRVWLLEVRSPQLRAYRKSLGLSELPHDNAGKLELPFHITVAIRKRSKRPRGSSKMDALFDNVEQHTKAAYSSLDLAFKIAALYADHELFEPATLTKRADDAATREHEDKCKRCGDCCKLKVAVDGKIYQSSAACPYLDKQAKLCSIYERRFELNPYCHPITDLVKSNMAPAHCGYVDEHYKSALADEELPVDSLPDRLVIELFKAACGYNKHVKAAGLVVEHGSPSLTPLYDKLAAVLDLSPPAEEVIDDETPTTLAERQSEATQVIKDTPSAVTTRVKTEVARESHERPKTALSKEELHTLATKLQRMGVKPPRLHKQSDVVLAYEQLVPLADRAAMEFTKQADDTAYGRKLREIFEKMELDEDVVESTLNRRARNVSTDLILDATRKLIRINKGEDTTDDRDALAYQYVYGPEKLFVERIERDAGDVGRKLLWRSTFKGKVKQIAPGVLSPQLRSLVLKSGLAAPLEEVNPLESYDQQLRVTRMGEGGMSSTDSVPDDARSVQPSHFGIIDPIRAPESMKIGVDSRVTYKTYRGSDGQFYADMLDARTGEVRRVGVQELANSVVAFPGELASNRTEVRAMINGRDLGYVNRAKVQYELPHTSHMFTITSNMVPAVSAIKGGRLLMGAKMSLGYDEPIVYMRGDNLHIVKIGEYKHKPGDLAPSIDSKTKQITWLPIKAKITHQNKCGMVCVQLDSGRKIVATDSHSFVTMGDDGELIEVAAGDLIKGMAIPRAGRLELPVAAREFKVAAGSNTASRPVKAISLDRDFGWIVGMYLAAGWATPKESMLEFAARTPELRQRIYDFFKKYDAVSNSFDKRSFDRIRIHWAAFTKKLVDEFGRGPTGKRLPGWCFSAPIEFREGVIAGYLAGSDYTLKHDCCRVNGGTRSKQLRDGLSLLLTTIGIDTTLCETMITGAPFYYFIVRAEHVDRLPDIGHLAKEYCHKELPARSGKESSNWMPIYYELHSEIVAKTARESQARQRCYVQQHTKASVSEIIGSGNTTAHKWLDSAVIWDRVKRVDELNPAESPEVYDLDLDGNVFMCANGVFVHNSTQALPLRGAEAPLVQNLADNGQSFEELYGDRLGAVKAKGPGRVEAVTRDYIKVRYADGSTVKHELYNQFPFNRKSVTGDTIIYIKRASDEIWIGPIRDYCKQAGDCTLTIDPETRQSAWLPVIGYIKHDNNKTLLRIELETGHTFTVTEDHSLLVMGADGRLTPAYPKDCTRVTALPLAMMPAPLTLTPLSVEQALFIGLYLTAGELPADSTNEISISVNSTARAIQLREFCKRLGVAEVEYIDNAPEHYVRVVDATLVSLIRKYCYDGDKRTLNNVIYSCDSTIRRAVISGCISGSGAVHVTDYFELLLTLRLPLALRDVIQALFMSLGMATKCTVQGDECELETSSMDYPTAWILYKDAVIVNSPKQPIYWDRIPVHPVATEYIGDRMREIGLSDEAVATMVRDLRISPMLAKLVNTNLKVWAFSDVRWAAIKSITAVEHEDFVYDLSVEKAEAFAINGGVVVHNTYIHNTPLVAVGRQVNTGDVLAKSNYTDDKGRVALGRNLRVGYMTYRGFNADDAIVLSESAAKKLASEHMYTIHHKPKDNEETGKRAFLSLFPGEFNKQQLATIADNGVVKPGTVVHQGDPLVLTVNKRKPRGRGMLAARKSLYTKAAETWDHTEPGVVTDVERTSKGWKVLVKAYAPMHVADKLSNRMGGKGVVSAILPDDEMPHDSQGRPLEILLSPLGVVSRVNPAQLVETLLGKVAVKTGKSYKIPGFIPDSYVKFARQELKKAGLTDTEDLTDPKTGRKIPKVFTGVTYMMKLHHMAEPKSSGRDVGTYTSEGIPAGGGPEGSKRIGTGELSALISHGAVNVIRDAKVIRGQKNDDYWRAIRLGYPPPSPKIPAVYERFMAYLQGAGINVRKSGDVMHLYALTDDDVDAISAGPVTKAATVKGDTLDPVKNGLFDVGKTGGHGGNRWTHITLAEPMPNPVMEEPIRRMLGLTKQQFMDVLAGKRELGGETGAKALKHALQRIKLDSAIESYASLIDSAKGAERDNAIKVLGYLRTLKKAGIKPEQLMLTKVPVIPPNFRPITEMNGLQMISDPNFLYTDLMAANEDYADLKRELGAENAGDERVRLYKAFKAVTGLGDPIAAKTRETGVKGLLKHIFGGSPKFGMFQRRVLGAAVDLVGRGVITPNPSLNMDQVGLPESKAWVLYRPFVVGSLVRRGMSAMAAAKAVEQRTPAAKQALLDEMAKRPVIINRAPVLHRYGMMAAWPVLTKGETLQIPPIVTGGFNADFDGDAMNYHVPASDEAVQDAVNKMLPSRNLRAVADFDVHYTPKQEFLYGLHLATTARGRRTHTFLSKKDVYAAFRRGEIGIGDIVTIAKD